MATSKQPVSILKKSPTALTKADRDLQTALYHATIIQQRKDVELEILLSTERMLDFPLSSESTALNPALSDVALFKDLLQPFQPSDYDCLIQERNIDGRCGYALCPNPRVEERHKGKYRIINKNGRAKDFRIVPSEELEMWCSDDCATRAMYVKVQLNERPAWERAMSNKQVELLDEIKAKQQIVSGRFAEDFGKLSLLNEDMNHQDAGSLALERGDRGAAAINGRVNVSINERDVADVAIPPSLDMNDVEGAMHDMHLDVEGHRSGLDSYYKTDTVL